MSAVAFVCESNVCETQTRVGFLLLLWLLWFRSEAQGLNSSWNRERRGRKGQRGGTWPVSPANRLSSPGAQRQDGSGLAVKALGRRVVMPAPNRGGKDLWRGCWAWSARAKGARGAVGPPGEEGRAGAGRAGGVSRAPRRLWSGHPRKDVYDLGHARECRGREHQVNKRGHQNMGKRRKNPGDTHPVLSRIILLGSLQILCWASITV